MCFARGLQVLGHVEGHLDGSRIKAAWVLACALCVQCTPEVLAAAMGQSLPKPVMSIVMEQDAAARDGGVEDVASGANGKVE